MYHRDEFLSDLKNFPQSKYWLGYGHQCWATELAELFQDITLVTFLREPVDRCISHFYHFKRSENPDHQPYKNLSLEQFLNTRFAQNWQCRRLGGGFYDSSLSDERCYEEALKNVNSRFALTGITERMGESLALLSQFTPKSLPQPERTNVNPSPEAAELKKQWREKIIEKNSFDAELYRQANALLNTKITS